MQPEAVTRQFMATEERRSTGWLFTSAQLRQYGGHWYLHIWIHGAGSGHLIFNYEAEAVHVATEVLGLEELQ